MRNRGPGRAPLDELLDAATAPATAEELSGEKAAVAAFTAHRRRAARAARRRQPARKRTAIVAVTTGLALLSVTGTAVAARTGNLPQDAQQHAHRLFSALGVPAPRTGAPSPSSPTPLVTSLSWCDNWTGPRPLSSENRRKLVAAAGGEDRVERYCAGVRRSASAAPGSASPGTPPGRPGTLPAPTGPDDPATPPSVTAPPSVTVPPSPTSPPPGSAEPPAGPPATEPGAEQSSAVTVPPG
jgi:hypothetical protein